MSVSHSRWIREHTCAPLRDAEIKFTFPTFPDLSWNYVRGIENKNYVICIFEDPDLAAGNTAKKEKKRRDFYEKLSFTLSF